mgnify:CR=1 FL=1
MILRLLDLQLLVFQVFHIIDFKYTYEGDDLVNATPAGKTLQVVATVDKAGYTGQIKAPFIINKRTLNPDKLELTLKKNTVSYAERSKISSDYVTVKDTVTGETLPNICIYSYWKWINCCWH